MIIFAGLFARPLDKFGFALILSFYIVSTFYLLAIPAISGATTILSMFNIVVMGLHAMMLTSTMDGGFAR